MGCNHGTGRGQYWHLAVTCNITVVIVKTIEIVAYLLYQITKNNPRALWYERVVKMISIAYSGLFWTQFRVSLDLFTGLTAGKVTVRTFFTAVTYSSQSNSKLYVQKNNYVPNSPVELAQCHEVIMSGGSRLRSHVTERCAIYSTPHLGMIQFLIQQQCSAISICNS